MQLAGKKIVLGATGSIAAYKAAHLCRLLKNETAEVVITTFTSAPSFFNKRQRCAAL